MGVKHEISRFMKVHGTSHSVPVLQQAVDEWAWDRMFKRYPGSILGAAIGHLNGLLVLYWDQPHRAEELKEATDILWEAYFEVSGWNE